MKRIFWWVSCLILCTSFSAYAVELSVTAEYWVPDTDDIQLKIQRNGSEGMFNLNDDLGMDDDEDVVGATVDIKVGRSNHFLLSYWGFDMDSGKILTEPITYNGALYGVGEDVSSDFDMDKYGFGYAYDIIDFETFHVGLVLDVVWYHIETELRSDLQPVGNTDNVDLLLPFPGLRFGKGFLNNKLRFGGQIQGAWWQGSGFLQAHGGLTYHPIEKLAIGAGYRYLHLDVTDDDDAFNIKLNGPRGWITYTF